MSSDIDPRIKAAFAEVFPHAATLTAMTAPADVKGWDSMSHVRFIMGVEERVGVQFRPKEIARVRCIGDLQALVAKRTRNG